MQSTLFRALIGFAVLIVGITAMSAIAINSLARYPDAPWWSMMLIIIIALVLSVLVFITTAGGPLYDWIAAPALREQEQLRSERERLANEARRGVGGAVQPGTGYKV